MARPNPHNHKPTPRKMRELLDRCGLSPLMAGRAVGLTERTIHRYLDGTRKFNYPVQFALESLPKKRL